MSEDALIEVRKKSYTRWLNFALQEEVVSDIVENFADGKTLASIASRITSQMAVGIDFGEQGAELSDEARIKNIQASLELFKKDSVNTSDISAEAIANKDISAVFALVEQLIITYQMGVEKGSVGVGLLNKRMMTYANEKCANLGLLHLDNFDKCFEDGGALCALIATKFPHEFSDPKKISEIPTEERFHIVTHPRSGFPNLFDVEDLRNGLIDPHSIFLFIGLIQYSPFNIAQDKHSRQRSSLAVARFQRQGSKNVAGKSSLYAQQNDHPIQEKNNNENIEKLNSLVREISRKYSKLTEALSGNLSSDQLQSSWASSDDNDTTTYQTFSFSDNEINSLKDNFEQFKNQKNNLHNELENVKKAITQYREKLDELDRSKGDLSSFLSSENIDEKIANEQANSEKISNEIKEVGEKALALSSLITSIEEEIKAKEGEVAAANNEEDQKKAQEIAASADQLQSERDTLSSTIDSLTSQLQSKKDEYEKQSEVEKGLAGEIVELKSKIEQLEKEKSSAGDNNHQDIENEINQLNGSINTAEGEKGELERAIQQLDEKVKSLEESIFSASVLQLVEIHEISHDLNSANDLLAKLQSHLQSKENSNSDLSSQLSSLQSADVSSLKGEITQLEEKKAEVEAAVKQINEQINEHSSSSSKLEGDLTSLSSSLSSQSSLLSSSQNSFAEKNKSHEDQLKSLSDDIANLSSDLSKEESKIVDYENQLKSLQEGAGGESANEGDLHSLEEKIAQLSHSSSDLANQKSNLEAQLAQLSSDLSSLQSSHSSLQNELADLDGQLASLSSSQSQSHQSLADIQKQIADHGEKITTLQSEKGSLENQIPSLEQLNQSIILPSNDDVDRVQSDINQFTSDIAKLNDEIAQSEKRIEELKSLFGVISSAINIDLSSLLSSDGAHLPQLNQLVDDLKSKLNERQQANQSRDTLNHLTEQLTNLKNEVAELTKKRDDQSSSSQHELSHLLKQKNDLQTQIEKLKENNQIEELKKSLQTIEQNHEQNVNKIQGNIRAASEAIQSNTATLDNLQKEIQKHQQEKNSILEHEKKLREAVEEKNNEVLSLQKKIREAKAQAQKPENNQLLNALKSQLQSLENENQHHSNDLKSLRSNIDKLNGERSKKSENLRLAQNEISAMITTLDALKNEKVQIRKEAKKLRLKNTPANPKKKSKKPEKNVNNNNNIITDNHISDRELIFDRAEKKKEKKMEKEEEKWVDNRNNNNNNNEEEEWIVKGSEKPQKPKEEKEKSRGKKEKIAAPTSNSIYSFLEKENELHQGGGKSKPIKVDYSKVTPIQKKRKTYPGKSLDLEPPARSWIEGKEIFIFIFAMILILLVILTNVA